MYSDSAISGKTDNRPALRKLLNDTGVILLSATEHFTDDASGRFFRNIMMSYAQYYSDELRLKFAEVWITMPKNASLPEETLH